MAAISYGEQLLPAEVKHNVAGFFTSGLQQLERVISGPRARHEGKSEDAHTSAQPSRRPSVSSTEVDIGTGLPGQGHQHSAANPSSLSSKDHSAFVQAQQSGSCLKAESVFILASVPASAAAFTDAESAQAQLRILSDTVRHIFAGTAARTMSQAFVHPIDTVKTRMQINKASAPLPLKLWREQSKDTTVRVMLGRHQILRLRNWLVKGPVDLYRGLTGAVVGTVPVALVYFSTYESCKSFLEEHGVGKAAAHLSSASLGAVLSAFIRVPTDTLKHRTQAYITPNVFVGARDIAASKGIQGLYSGLLPTLLRDVPELTLQFTLYEVFRTAFERHRKVKKLRTWEHLILGGVSGAIAATATMPLDVAKTAMQCGANQNIARIFQDLVREKGIAGLYAGMGPRVSLIALQGAAFFTLFEAWKAQLKPEPHRIGKDKHMRPKLWTKNRDHIWKRQFVFQ